MQLADYVRFLRRRALLVLVAALFGLGGAYIATERQDEVYRTDAQLIVSVTQSGSDGVVSRRPLAVEEAEALAQLAGTPAAVSGAQERAGGGQLSSVRATADGNSPFIILSVEGPDPVAIAEIANAYADVLPEVQQELQQADPGTTVTLLAASPAPVNTVPVAPRPKQNMAIGLVLGLTLGLAAAFAREALDRRVRDSADLERELGLPRLGSIPKELGDVLLPAWSEPSSLRSEAYRLVRANLQFTDLTGSTPVLLVTSSNPGDGKTSLATNLAVSFALAGERVVLVDCDLRRPRVAAHFDLAPSTGLSDVLAGRQPLELVLSVMQGLDVLPAGPLPPNPGELLGTQRMVQLLEHLGRTYDRVILDGPPVLAVADAVKLSSLVTGVVIVLRIGATTTDDVSRAKQSLDLAGARVLGIVANQVRPGQDGAYGYASAAAYGYTPKRVKGGKRRQKRAAPRARLAPTAPTWRATAPEPGATPVVAPPAPVPPAPATAAAAQPAFDPAPADPPAASGPDRSASVELTPPSAAPTQSHPALGWPGASTPGD